MLLIDNKNHHIYNITSINQKRHMIKCSGTTITIERHFNKREKTYEQMFSNNNHHRTSLQ